jgi:hypothetical protein
MSEQSDPAPTPTAFLSHFPKWKWKPWELTFPHWEALDRDMTDRLTRLWRDGERLNADLKRANAFQIAATDLFVEKAQIHLTIRARVYSLAGTLLAIVCFFLLYEIVETVAKIDVVAFVKAIGELTWQVAFLAALRAAGLAGFAGGAIYFAASLSRAFFHEATTLFNRRHALRFGRMYIYLKYGESTDEHKVLSEMLQKQLNDEEPLREDHSPSSGQPRKRPLTKFDANLLAYFIHRDVKAEDLERAFGWNLQMQTAFQDIRPEVMSANVYSRTLDTMGKLVDRLAKLKTKPDEE